LVSLAARHDVDVVALTLDVGQGRQLETVRQAALDGSRSRHVLDVRDEFARLRGSLRWPTRAA
jgi:argininosuccinate synthase